MKPLLFGYGHELIGVIPGGKASAMSGYAVVELNTTGFHGAGADRIVEMAVVHVNEHGKVTGEWSTLINPGRDIGSHSLHGITARQIAQAPRLRAVAATMLEQLSGRVLVAHNARFHAKFLFFRLCSLGHWMESAVPAVCTMEWSNRLLKGAPRGLVGCCRKAGIVVDDKPDALVRARATAALLGHFLEISAPNGPWADVWTRNLSYTWPVHDLPPTPPALATRSSAAQRSITWLAQLLDKMPRLHDTITESYLACVEEAMLIPGAGLAEARQLIGLASSLGIDHLTIARLHTRYFDDLAMVAGQQGPLSADNLDQLRGIAAMLQLAPARVEAVLERHTPTAVEAVVLTAEQRRTASLAH